MTDSRPPVWLLAEGDLTVRAAPLRPRVGGAWLVAWRHEEGLLRRTPLPADSTGVMQTSADASWLHGFLDRLAATGFPAPRPFPAFGGRSWTTGGGSLWQLVSFLPGQVIGWASAPSLTEVGMLLGRYHVAAAALAPVAQRPAALPLADVPAILLSGQVEAAGVGPDQAAEIRSLAAGLATDLASADQASTGRLVIHGDFTCHNVLAAGAPPAAVGVIDFELAHAESPLADIGYGLWRSGRPHQDAACVDASRVAQFVRGYASVRAIPADQAALIAVYLRGRGLQMIAKRLRAGQPETGMLAQVSWLSAQREALAEICARAC